MLETKTGPLNVESSAQPFSHHASFSDPYDWSVVDRSIGKGGTLITLCNQQQPKGT